MRRRSRGGRRRGRRCATAGSRGGALRAPAPASRYPSKARLIARAVAGAAAERVEVVDDAGRSPGEFVVRVAGLELHRHFLAAVEVMVEAVELQKLVVLAVHHGEMRPVGLVEAEHVVIDVPGLDVDGAVRRVGDRIDRDRGAAGMNAPRDLGHGIDGAEDVGGVGHGDELRARPSSAGRARRGRASRVSGSRPQVLITTPRFSSARHGPMLDSWSKSVTTTSSPGCKRPSMALGEPLEQHGRRRPEHDLLGAGGVQQKGDAGAGLGAAVRRRAATAVARAGLHAGGEEVVTHAVGHAAQHQGAAGIVEIARNRRRAPETGCGRRRGRAAWRMSSGFEDGDGRAPAGARRNRVRRRARP